VADNVLVLPGQVRLVYGAGLLGGLVFMLVRYVVMPAVRPLTDEMVAAHLEKAYPDLDNRLINSVLLSQERIKDRLTRRMVASQIHETAANLSRRELDRGTDPARLWRWGKWALALSVVFVAYGLLFSEYLSNAFMRYTQPRAFIPPVTDTRLSISPGDAELLQGESLLVEAYTEGVLPEKALIYYQEEGNEPVAGPMDFEGSSFIYEFTNLQRSFCYWVKAGDATSARYQVRVKTRPTIQEVTITYDYPRYTGMGQRTEVSAAGNIAALIGTTVRIQARADRPLGGGWMEIEYLGPAGEEESPAGERIALSAVDEDTVGGQFVLTRSGQYRLLVRDLSGVENEPQVRQIVARPDEAPVVKFLQPGKSVAVPPDAEVTLLAEARDDFSLNSLSLMVQRRAGEPWQELQRWPCEPGQRQRREGVILKLKELDLAVGDTLMYYMLASDGRERPDEQAGRSRTYQISVVDPAVAEKTGNDLKEMLRAVVQKLIQLQQVNLDATVRLAGWDAAQHGAIETDADARAHFQAQAAKLTEAEEGIYATAAGAARMYSDSESSEMAEMLGRIAAQEITQAVGQLQKLRALAETADIPPSAQAAANTEKEVLALLKRLLENPEALLAERLEKEGKSEDLEERLEDLSSNRERAEKMLKAIRQFNEEQREVIELTSRLKDVPVDDFTEGDEKTLDKIIEIEEKWARYFQETATDLSKLPPQDFSLASQAKEHLEVYSEIQKAIDAAQQKAVELAVPLEQAGMELAESIETNIEKWLMEEPDKLKWSMEDPIQDYDVPLADLPEELEDLIGDLLEQEEDMTEDIEDVTSAWLDSIDKGIGWDTMDGPISNMSAKGVTGNLMPNKQEVGGRSGEGRTAKSSGQFVEETATGKGGRHTPTRLTPDAFEGGAVKDTSPEPATGASGGGKLSGWGAEGLQGPPPPAVQQKLKRLAQQQQQLIDQARRIDHGLQKYRYPRGELPATIRIMEELHSDLEQADISNFTGKHRVVLSNLREVKELVDKQKQVWRERSKLLPQEVRDEIAAALDEGVPRQYRQMVSSYFRALSESAVK